MERARERAAWIAVLSSIPMVAQLVAARAVRDTVFLSEYEASYLPRVMFASAAFSLAAAVWVSRTMPRWGPRSTAFLLTALNGSMFVLEAAMIDVAPRTVAVLTYIHVSVVGALVVSAFSSVVNERFDPHYAKSVVSRVGMGATFGGVLGGVLAWVLSDAVGLSAMLYGLGGFSVLVGIGVWNVGKSTQAQTALEDQSRFGIQTIREDSYLSRVALTVMLLGVVGVLVDYAMKAEADARFDDSESLLSFFAIFYMATALLTFIVQAGFARPLLRKLGLGRTMVILPVVVALTAGFGALWTRLWTATLARGSQTVLSSSLFRSSYELLYTPIPPLKKRATKAVIDIASNRIGHGVGSAIVMLIVVVIATPTLATTWVLVVATIVAAVAAWMVLALQEGYVAQLASSLRDGSIALRSSDIVDATTLHTIAETTTLSREELLKGIAELGSHEADDAREAAQQRDTWTAQLSDLLSDDPSRVLGVLSDESLTPRLAGLVIDLLAKDAYAQPAYTALERMGAPITGQLVDAMLAPANPVEVRRRIPRLLRKLQEPRAVNGLSEGLRDEEFEVRNRCGQALVEMRRGERDLVFPSASILDAIAAELDSPGSLSEEREEETLQYLFTLLSVVLDPDAISLSLRALSSEDQNLRGTALEYLHNVLPDSVREPLWPRLTERSSRPPIRPKSQAPEELLRSMQSLMLTRDQLEK